MTQLAATPPSRSHFRPYSLDGAMLYFHPETGTHVRIANAATRAFRRSAPRVAMFGITNACNLACEFCSRDTTRDSLWTVSSAAALLRGLAQAGTLEVAFGGGEPFAFRGFAELLTELHATTSLALHVTTNGTLLREPVWRRVQGLLGQVRMSIYAATPWREAADLLAGSHQLWGANVLVDRASLADLPMLLAELAHRRCHDVSLLSYVGADRGRHLDRDDELRLARVIAESPLSCRLSVCFGARVPVPRLFAGVDNNGDCGAGYDFVSITPDQRVQSCSFQDGGLPGATAEQVLAAWRLHQVRLAQPSPRSGCARALPIAQTAPPIPPVAVWRAFSGNNSGECVLVATFETVDDAEQFLGELVPGFEQPAQYRSRARYSPTWQALFTAEGLFRATDPDDTMDGGPPDELDRIGCSVIALGYAAEDAFPELRALAWKRGGFVVPGGIHAHGLTALAAIRASDRRDARTLADAKIHNTARSYQYGEWVLLSMPFKHNDSRATLRELKELLTSYAGARPMNVEIVDVRADEADVVHAMQRRGDELPARPRMFLSFPRFPTKADAEAGVSAAARFAASLDSVQAYVVGNEVLIEPIGRRERLSVYAYRHRASVHVLEGLVVKVSAGFWLTEDQNSRKRRKARRAVIDRDVLWAALSAVLPPRSMTLRDERDWRNALRVDVETSEPIHILAVLRAEAQRLGCELSIWVSDLDPLAWAVRRLLA